MSFLFTFLSFLVFCFPLFYSPVSMVGLLMVISLSFVSILAFFGSFWYSYILFFVFVGGLLVLFIYICLVSSNFPLKVNFESVIIAGTLSLMCSFLEDSVKPYAFLGQSNSSSGVSIVDSSNISIFLFLVVLLLVMLLIVVRVSGAGSSIVVDEKT